MQIEEIKSKIKQIMFETTNIKPEDIEDNASFVDDLHLDSLTLLEIAVNIDHEFSLDIPEDDMQKFNTVQVSAELVMQQLAPVSA